MADPCARAAMGKSVNRYYYLDSATVRDAVCTFAPRLSGRLLEVGCGLLPYKEVIEPFVTRYVASDFARSSAADVRCDGARLPFREKAFDCALCTQVLEHVPDPLCVLVEIARVLRPGGLLLLTVPLNSGIHMAPDDYFRFTEYGLRELCKRAGLAADVVAERGGRVANAAQSLLLVFEDDRMPSRHLGAALARRGIRMLSWLVRQWALPLDRRFAKPGNPLGYAVLARKPVARARA